MRKRAARGHQDFWGHAPEGFKRFPDQPFQFSRFSSALRLVGRRRGRTGLVLRHELVELFLVLGVTQTVEEVLELDLLFLEPLGRLGAVLVEGAPRRSSGSRKSRSSSRTSSTVCVTP